MRCRAGDEVEIPLPPDQARDLNRRAAQLGVTVNTLVQGAWGLLLGQLTGRQDVVFINTVPVRVRYGPGDTVADLLTRLQTYRQPIEPRP